MHPGQVSNEGRTTPRPGWRPGVGLDTPGDTESRTKTACRCECNASEPRDKWNGNLITFQRRIVIAVILGANDTLLRGVKIRRVSWQIGEFVVRPGEEESCILTCCDADFRDVSLSIKTAKEMTGMSHSKLRTGECIEKKEKRRELTRRLLCQSTADCESVSWRFEVLRDPIRVHLVIESQPPLSV